ncbi:MAG: hypothetical protein GXP27_02155 [Planctomycetes bacterium]|nr:hypothetical protein [Planctomycetota bacterium]
MKRPDRTSRPAGAPFLAVLLVWFLGGLPLLASPRLPTEAPFKRVYTSRHFILHTDLPRSQAGEMLARMEKAIVFAEKHWGRPLRTKIECYVARHVDRWPDSDLPHPLARVYIGGVGGATVARSATPHAASSRRADSRSRRSDFSGHQAVVYACADRGVVEHEVIHAYCYQAFGRVGPDWYKEGMAQMGGECCAGGRGAWRSPEALQRLRRQPRPTVEQIIRAKQLANPIGGSLNTMLARARQTQTHAPLSDWTEHDAKCVAQIREDYLWCWALCHLLAHNPNYSRRFRAVGAHYLVGRMGAFDYAFSAVRRQLQFEYDWFLDHIEVGYRVDLCHWDWDVRFRSLEETRSVRRRILAARGFQASGLRVQSGQRYRYQTEGRWSTAANKPFTDADGAADGSGRLVGVIMKDFRLTEPFDLGADGVFVAPSDGTLYLRCRDRWNELGDNRGAVVVQWGQH